MNSELELRPATADDALAAVPLIHDSGPVAMRFVFAQRHREESLAFLDSSYRASRGQFSWRNHLVAEREGRVIATCAVWDARANAEFTRVMVRQILGFYGLGAAAVILRGLRFERIVRPAAPGPIYIAHVTVAPELRGQGIGRALLKHVMARARADGYTRAALDVAHTNPRARALYEGLGFGLVATRCSALPERWGERVCDHHYLECPL